MAVVLAEFSDPVVANGIAYRAQACGGPLGNIWEGWIEFIPVGGGPALRSARETTQPNFADAQYWASGLTHVYLEGALSRALNPIGRVAATRARAMFDGPAPEPVLDPFSVYEKGEARLRQELAAMSTWHLVNIVRAFDLSEQPIDALNAASSSELIETIVSGVRRETRVNS
jgi:hypothetical protein